MNGQTVLIVEDDADIREMLRFSLARDGYKVVEAESADDAVRILDKPGVDLILLDWMLPGMSGIEFVRRMRTEDHIKDLPVMMLTAKGEEVDMLRGFDSGADDYLTKPFSPKELLARVRALIRRTVSREGEVLAVADLCLDVQSHRVSIGGEVVHAGPTEYRLLEFFMRNPERVFSREQLLDRVWGRAVYVDDRTVDVHVLRLRKLLAPKNYDQYVQTVRGAGYRFSSKVL